jgi:hypothetical protein
MGLGLGEYLSTGRASNTLERGDWFNFCERLIRYRLTRRAVLVLIRGFLILVLLASAALAPALLPSPVRAQSTDTSVLYVSPPASHSNQSFIIQVNLNLSSSEAFNAYDIQLTFSNATLQFQSLAVSSQEQEIAHCINGVGLACNISDGPGIIHSAADFSTILQGPITALTLFSVQFIHRGTGTSLFHPFNDTLANPNPAPHPILHLTQDGFYSNYGVAAFFNVSPAILVVNQPVSFDGRESFSPGGTITTFSWNFGDGTNISGPQAIVPHTYTSPAQYSVTLNVTDQNGSKGKISKTVPVSSALGQITINIRSATNDNVPNPVTVSLYNGTFFVENQTKPALFTGALSFHDLQPGTYRLNFNGPGVVSSTMPETVISGWTTYDTAFLTLIKPSTDSGSLTFYLLLVVLVGVGIVLGAVAILRRRTGKKRTRLKSSNQ